MEKKMETNQNPAPEVQKITLLDRCRTFSKMFSGGKTEIFRVYLPVTPEEADKLLQASRVFVAQRENVPLEEKEVQKIPAGLALGEIFRSLLGVENLTENLPDGFFDLCDLYPVAEDTLITAQKQEEEAKNALAEMQKFLPTVPPALKPAFESGIKAQEAVLEACKNRVASLIKRRATAEAAKKTEGKQDNEKSA